MHELIFTPQADADLREIENNPSQKNTLKAVRKCLGFLETNLRHPSLNTHEFRSLKGPNGEKVFEAYVQQKTPGAYRVFWYDGPGKRMAKRGISTQIVKQVLLEGEIIEDYPDDKPFPTSLFLGWFQREPFHVVSALDSLSGYCFVITVYRRNLDHFEADYKTRK